MQSNPLQAGNYVMVDSIDYHGYGIVEMVLHGSYVIRINGRHLRFWSHELIHLDVDEVQFKLLAAGS